MSPIQPVRLRRRSVPLAMLAAMVLSGWTLPIAAQPAAPPPLITVVAREASFEAPSTFPAGLVAITVVNEAPGQAEAQISRLKPGTTMEAVSAALQLEDQTAFFALVTPAGGVPSIEAGRSQGVVLTLTEGDYFLLNFFGDQPVLHPFRVVGPSADGEVMLRDFSFSAPTLRTGQMTLKVANLGTQPHEMLLGKLAPGVRLPEVLAFQDDPIEAGLLLELMGGLSTIEAGATAWTTLSLTPGTYGMVCFIPDPASGKPHAELGMATEFTVP